MAGTAEQLWRSICVLLLSTIHLYASQDKPYYQAVIVARITAPIANNRQPILLFSEVNDNGMVNGCGLNATAAFKNLSLCLSGFGFKSLNACRILSDDYDEPFTFGIDVNDPVLYKVLVVNPQVDNLTDIQTTVPTLHSSQFLNSTNERLKICDELPYTTLYCHKACYPFKEFVVKKNQQLKTLYSTYNFDEYFFLNDTKSCVGAVVCEKSASSFLVFCTCCLVISTVCVCVVLIMNLCNNERRNCTGPLLLYHLIILIPGLVAIMTKSVVSTYWTFYYPADECVVMGSLQHFLFLVGCIGTNLNSRKIIRLLQQDRTFADEKRQRKQQVQVIARLASLFLWFIFIIFTFEGDLLYMPNEFYPVSTIHCWHRFSYHPLFICYAGWMAITVLSAIIIPIYLTKKFAKWNNVKIELKPVIISTCCHIAVVLFQVFLYWLFLNLILPWEMYYSLSSGVIDLCKAVQVFFIFIIYMWDTSKFSTISVIICKYGCCCFQTA